MVQCHLGKFKSSEQSLWQRAKKCVESDKTWYDNSSLGKMLCIRVRLCQILVPKLNLKEPRHDLRSKFIFYV